MIAADLWPVSVTKRSHAFDRYWLDLDGSERQRASTDRHATSFAACRRCPRRGSRQHSPSCGCARRPRSKRSAGVCIAHCRRSALLHAKTVATRCATNSMCRALAKTGPCRGSKSIRHAGCVAHPGPPCHLRFHAHRDRRLTAAICRAAQCAAQGQSATCL